MKRGNKKFLICGRFLVVAHYQLKEYLLSFQGIPLNTYLEVCLIEKKHRGREINGRCNKGRRAI